MGPRELPDHEHGPSAHLAETGPRDDERAASPDDPATRPLDRFDAVVDALDAVVWEYDLAQRKVTMVSPHIEVLTGFRPEALLGRADAWRRLVPEVEHARVADAIAALGVSDRAEVVHRITRADGTERRVRSRLRRHTAPDGRTTLLGIATDVTREHDDFTRRRMALARVAGGIAHQFNNLLAVISGNLQFLSSEASHPHVLADLRDAARAAETAASLTRRLLAFAERQPLQPRPVWIDPLLAEVSSQLQAAARDAVRVEVTSNADAWPCRVDAAHLTAVLAELVENADDASPDGATVRVTARCVPRDVPTRPLDGVEIVVRDEGRGMDDDRRREAIEPFYSTREGHVGLGLSMAWGFARQSRGVLHVESAPGVGTTVRLWLPRADEGPP